MRFSTISALIVLALAYGAVQAAPSAECRSESSIEPAVSKAPKPNISYHDYDAIIRVCSAENCGGTYDPIALSGLHNTCYYPAINFESIIA
ncbi:hypothetical protein SCP_0311600 [Sparassis crispa]|uniref:Uncharacterized protein n=1 Tax=Sparassis crispa TaxID=139825 RepID=A0A401GH30_9APHY|nr:hypothetical protein SCP_0311600 [Sparassis crispa]GBE81431.1 hypothetical protein SCP_0311600 [Sparassis crispa]